MALLMERLHQVHINLRAVVGDARHEINSFTHLSRSISAGASNLAQRTDIQARCLIPGFDGAIFSLEWKEALWARFCTGTPQRQRQSVEQYKIVKRA